MFDLPSEICQTFWLQFHKLLNFSSVVTIRGMCDPINALRVQSDSHSYLIYCLLLVNIKESCFFVDCEYIVITEHLHNSAKHLSCIQYVYSHISIVHTILEKQTMSSLFPFVHSTLNVHCSVELPNVSGSQMLDYQDSIVLKKYVFKVTIR